MFSRSLLCAGIALGALFGAAGAANAQATVGAMDSCEAHDWNSFADAVEARDVALLQAMLNDPENRICEDLRPTVEALACELDPLGCVEPSAGTPDDDVPDDDDDQPGDDDDQPGTDDGPFGRDGPFPGQAPGEHVGTENDRPDNDNPSDDGGNDGGNDGGGRDTGGGSTGAAGRV